MAQEMGRGKGRVMVTRAMVNEKGPWLEERTRLELVGLHRPAPLGPLGGRGLQPGFQEPFQEPCIGVWY
jgi:hypothetical protein